LAQAVQIHLVYLLETMEAALHLTVLHQQAAVAAVLQY
jgi:hypothetical protein